MPKPLAVGVMLQGSKGVVLLEYCEGGLGADSWRRLRWRCRPRAAAAQPSMRPGPGSGAGRAHRTAPLHCMESAGRDLHSSIDLKATGSSDRVFGWYRRGRRVAYDVARAISYLHSKVRRQALHSTQPLPLLWLQGQPAADGRAATRVPLGPPPDRARCTLTRPPRCRTFFTLTCAPQTSSVHVPARSARAHHIRASTAACCRSRGLSCLCACLLRHRCCPPRRPTLCRPTAPAANLQTCCSHPWAPPSSRTSASGGWLAWDTAAQCRPCSLGTTRLVQTAPRESAS